MNIKAHGKKVVLIVTAFIIGGSAQAQIAKDELQLNTITTAVPFLLITPDSRAGGMGDAGCASLNDVNAIHWNPSKLAFAEKKMGIGISYTPWLRALVGDINLAYVTGFYKTKKRGTFGASLRYFSLGDITFTDINGQTTGQFKPNEFAIDVAYATKLADNFSVGGAVRYINSNLTGNALVESSQTHAGRAVAVDISALYKKDKIKLGDKKAIFAAGINISNIGNKMSYSDRGDKNSDDFIPINMRIGGSLNINLDDYNSISILADINKLLVPTPPIYKYKVDTNGATTGEIDVDADGNPIIAQGKDPNRGVAEGMFGSFTDAPGGGAEELREVNYSIGLEYWYNHLFAVRAGYFYEHPTKGNRQFFTIGAGVRYNVFGLDFAYLIPTQQRNPLENTLRFTLTFDFDAFKAQNNEETKTE
ncbi:MAG: type IX secretion system outer membrane channel protein PorV [Bacteroidetes bacterium]|nr:type IX secretion system outer membrane channel protein PorV [Bacteroidota bacterium]